MRERERKPKGKKALSKVFLRRMTYIHMDQGSFRDLVIGRCLEEFEKKNIRTDEQRWKIYSAVREELRAPDVERLRLHAQVPIGEHCQH